MRKVVVFPAPHLKRGVSDGHKIPELAGNAVGANDDRTLSGVIGRSGRCAGGV